MVREINRNGEQDGDAQVLGAGTGAEAFAIRSKETSTLVQTSGRSLAMMPDVCLAQAFAIKLSSFSPFLSHPLWCGISLASLDIIASSDIPEVPCWRRWGADSLLWHPVAMRPLRQKLSTELWAIGRQFDVSLGKSRNGAYLVHLFFAVFT